MVANMAALYFSLVDAQPVNTSPSAKVVAAFTRIFFMLLSMVISSLSH
jgi:hypothetical protein